MTKGKIYPSLLRLALPIAAGQAMHMAYNITDMFWLGQLSSEALAAAGAAGLFMWLSVGLMLIGRVGSEIRVSQARGRGDIPQAYRYAHTCFNIAALLGVLFGAFLFIFRIPLIGFFNFAEAAVAADATAYLGIIAFGIPAGYMNAAIDGTFVASGNSRTPFLISAAGIILNMILTPILVFPMGLGVTGAAAASAIAPNTILIVRVIALKRSKNKPFETYRFINENLTAKRIISDIRTGPCRDVYKLTLPICLENSLFPMLTMVTTRIEVSFGTHALSISRVGSQIESLSWLVGAGFGAALTAFVGQNFGAGKPDRVSKAVKYAAGSLAVWGVIVTSVLWFGGSLILRAFLPDFRNNAELSSLFFSYLFIIGACQVFSNLEYAATNAFRGAGKTIPPSVVNISSNIIRVPLAFLLSRTPLGLLGVWIAVSSTAALRGIATCLWYIIDTRKQRNRA